MFEILGYLLCDFWQDLTWGGCCFRLHEMDFMEFSEVENHDDFYTLDDGRIHVQDQRGYYIVYDAAVKDLE